MYEQFANRMLALGKQTADATFKANEIAAKRFQEMMETQLAAAESRIDANGAFIKELGEVRDVEQAKDVWTNGLGLVKEHAEQAYATAQKVMDIGAKTGLELAELYKQGLDGGAGERAQARPKAAGNAGE